MFFFHFSFIEFVSSAKSYNISIGLQISHDVLQHFLCAAVNAIGMDV